MYGSPIQIKVMEDALTIGNRCILPEGWTVDTFMKAHESEPYNPKIANVFYRAGFIESWGQGIQKICDECRAIGADLPEYNLVGTSLRISFKALEKALIRENIANDKNGTLDGTLDGTLEKKILQAIKENPSITQTSLAQKYNVSLRTVKRVIKHLTDKKIIERKDGKRFGSWIIK